jgi:hypothetical protein
MLARRNARIGFVARLLNGKRGTDRRKYTWKLEHESIAHALDETTVMGWQYPRLHVADYAAPPSHDVAFVLFHEPDRLHQVHEQHRTHDPIAFAGCMTPGY